MATTAKRKTGISSGKAVFPDDIWDRLFVLCGEPWGCKQILNAVIEESGARQRWLTPTEAASLPTQLTSRSLFLPADVLVLSQPTSEMIKAVHEIFCQRGRMTPSAMVLYMPDSEPDARLSLISAAKKARRYTHIANPSIQQASVLTDMVLQWADGRFDIADNSWQWIEENAPTRMVPSKGGKDFLGFDLLALFSELEKAAAVVEYEHVPFDAFLLAATCRFKKECDVWPTIRAALSGNTMAALMALETLGISPQEQGPLWILLKELGLCLTASEVIADRRLKRRPIPQGAEASQALSTNRFRGAYLLDDYTEPAPQTGGSIHPFRAEKILEAAQQTSPSRVSSQMQAVVASIRDLRAGAHRELVIPCLALALSHQIEYQEPRFT